MSSDYLKNKSLCPLPFSGLYINPEGMVRCCSISRVKIGNLNTTPLEEIVNSSTVKKIRREMLDNKFPANCADCYAKEKHHKNINFKNISNRLYHVGKLGSAPFHLYKDENNFELLQLDARWRNTCNGACVYCDPSLSSRWAIELNDPRKMEKPAMVDSIEFIYKNLSKLKMLYLCGGEPFLMKENLKLLKTVAEVNPALDIRINTNLSNLKTPIFDIVKTLPNVQWILSAEATHEKFEYIRFPLKWDTFIANLKIIQTLPHKISINMTWNILNSYGIFEFIDNMIKLGVHPNSFVLNCLKDPQHLSIRNLPIKRLQEIKNTAEKKLDRLTEPFMLKYCYESIIEYCKKPVMNKQIELKKELEILDTRRNLESKTIFPELYEEVLN
jgi:radical SAM protein with 4Fe4S-binding SPASM domain